MWVLECTRMFEPFAHFYKHHYYQTTDIYRSNDKQYFNFKEVFFLPCKDKNKWQVMFYEVPKNMLWLYIRSHDSFFLNEMWHHSICLYTIYSNKSSWESIFYYHISLTMIRSNVWSLKFVVHKYHRRYEREGRGN